MKIAGLNSLLSSSQRLNAAFGLAAAATLTLGLMVNPAAAQGTPEQQAACQPDALRLCSEFVPDVDRITACMIKQRMRLSPRCRVLFIAPRKAKSFRHAS